MALEEKIIELESNIATKDDEILALQTQLEEIKAARAAPAPAVVEEPKAAPAPAPQPAPCGRRRQPRVIGGAARGAAGGAVKGAIGK